MFSKRSQAKPNGINNQTRSVSKPNGINNQTRSVIYTPKCHLYSSPAIIQTQSNPKIIIVNLMVATRFKQGTKLMSIILTMA